MIRFLFINLLIFMSQVSFAQDIDWQGHRGCRGLMPENTIPAFLEALNYPVTTLELDVVITKDKQVVVSHEPWMNSRICLGPEGNEIQGSGKQLNIYELTYEEVARYDCGSMGNPDYPDQQKARATKPLLSEVFKAIEAVNPNVSYNIEIKSEKKGDAVYHPEVEEFSTLVLDVIRDSGIGWERIVIQSFDFRVLRFLHEHHSFVHLAMLVVHGNFEKQVEELGFQPGIYSPYFKGWKRRRLRQHICKEFWSFPGR